MVLVAMCAVESGWPRRRIRLWQQSAANETTKWCTSGTGGQRTGTYSEGVAKLRAKPHTMESPALMSLLSV